MNAEIRLPSDRPLPTSTELREGAESICARLRRASFVAYLAGGCVRDRLLGVEPKDYDIATDARPEQVKKIFPKAKGVGAHFGVMLVRAGRHGTAYEIATFREDGEYSDGRRPDDVSFSTPERDAQRRDFTINGLFEDCSSGEIIDFVGGQEDLRAGVLRCIGDAEGRFGEDRLRLVRAVRFAARLGFKIDPATWLAMVSLAPTLAEVSAERIREEFARILAHPSRLIGFDLLVESGLMRQIVPEVYDLVGCEQPPQFHPEGDVFVHTRMLIEQLHPNAELTLVLGALLHDIGKPATYSYDEEAGRIRFNGHAEVGARMTQEILGRLKFPNDTVSQVHSLVAQHMDFMNVQQMRRAKLRRFIGQEHFDELLELHRVDCLSSNGCLENHQFVLATLEELSNEPPVPPRLITGHDLMERGFAAGRTLGVVLSAVQDEQLEGRIEDREAALAWVDQQYPDQIIP